MHAGDVLATVKAHDLDSDDNARITYQLMNRSSSDHREQEPEEGFETATSQGPRLFRLDAHTGQLSLRKSAAVAGGLQQLPDDDLSVYHLYLTATDHGRPSRSSTASLKDILYIRQSFEVIYCISQGQGHRTVQQTVKVIHRVSQGHHIHTTVVQGHLPVSYTHLTLPTILRV